MVFKVRKLGRKLLIFGLEKVEVVVGEEFCGVFFIFVISVSLFGFILKVCFCSLLEIVWFNGLVLFIWGYKFLRLD